MKLILRSYAVLNFLSFFYEMFVVNFNWSLKFGLHKYPVSYLKERNFREEKVHEIKENRFFCYFSGE